MQFIDMTPEETIRYCRNRRRRMNAAARWEKFKLLVRPCHNVGFWAFVLLFPINVVWTIALVCLTLAH